MKRIKDYFTDKELGIDIKNTVEQKGICFKDIKLEKGWRIPALTEAVAIINKHFKRIKFDTGKNDFFFKQPFNFKGNADITNFAGFVANSDRAYLYCYRSPQVAYPALGVLMVRDIKKKEDKK